MFCPKCSQAQVSEQVRFCSRCGFRLDAVKELIENDALAEKPRAHAETSLPPQKDISIGAALMFIGGIVAMMWGKAAGGRDADVLPQVFVILGFTLGFILLLLQPLLGALRKLFSGNEEKAVQLKKSRDGINLGALLMFLGTLKALVLTLLVRDAARRPELTLLIMSGMLLLLFVIRWLVQGVYRLFLSGKEDADDSRATAGLPEELTGSLEFASRPELSSAQSIPVESFVMSHGRTTETVEPASVTERTTNLLEKTKT
jgi:hypothetical protein